MGNFWLEDVSTEELVFLLAVCHVIRHSDAATFHNDEAHSDIRKELVDRGKIGHFDEDKTNLAVKTWLKAKKREFREMDKHPGNGYGVV